MSCNDGCLQRGVPCEPCDGCGHQRGVSCKSEQEREECLALVAGYREECHLIVPSKRERSLFFVKLRGSEWSTVYCDCSKQERERSTVSCRGLQRGVSCDCSEQEREREISVMQWMRASERSVM